MRQNKIQQLEKVANYIKFTVIDRAERGAINLQKSCILSEGGAVHAYCSKTKYDTLFCIEYVILLVLGFSVSTSHELCSNYMFIVPNKCEHPKQGVSVLFETAANDRDKHQQILKLKDGTE